MFCPWGRVRMSSAFFTAAGRPELVEELGTDDAATRNANIGAVYAAVAEIARSRSTAEWLELCDRLDIPATAFSRLEDLPAHPHLAAVGMFPVSEHPTEGKLRQPRPAARFAETPAGVHRHAPRLGEHTADVLRGVLDTQGVKNRKQARSKYGAKKEKA